MTAIQTRQSSSVSPELLGVLRVEAETNERITRLSDATVTALRDAGLFALGLPTEHGGVGGSLVATFDTVVRLAAADPAAAWVVGTCAVSKMLISDVFGAETATSLVAPDSLQSGTGHPTGELYERAGELRLTGSWSWISGVDSAELVMVGALHRGRDGARTMTLVALPRTSAVIDHDWDVAGMRGTGSNTVRFDDVLVRPEQFRTFAFDAFLPLYNSAVAVAPVIGAALEAGRLGRELLGVERPTMAGGLEKVGDSPAARMMVVEALQAIDDALALARAACSEADAGRHTFSDDEFGRLRVRIAHAGRTALAAFEPLLDVAGASAFRSSHPLQRLWRDASVAARHPVMNTASTDRWLADSLG